MILSLLGIFRHILPKTVVAITLWPFIIFRDKKDSLNKRLVNHERIHIRQQIELLVLPFYIIYLVEYVYNLLVYKNHLEAYHNISFEKEAYSNDTNYEYLSYRKMYAMWRVHYSK